MRHRLFVLLILLLLALISQAASPNFVVIFTDDQGYQDIGCFGSPNIKTPYLDQMAREGMKLTSFYVGSSVCTPSRAALLTGRYPLRYGMHKSVLFPRDKKGMPTSEETIAEVLKQKNYATGCIGKWHLGHLDPFLPMSQGFDMYYGIPYSNDMWLAKDMKIADDIVLNDGFTLDRMLAVAGSRKETKGMVPLMRGNSVIEFPANQATLTQRYTEEAVAFIEKNSENPFFLYFTPAMPHVPLFASEDFKGRSEGGLYGDAIEEIDWSVGQIMDALKANGLEENTLVVFTSDNGPWLAMGEEGGSALPLRNGKGSTFEGGLRVPCIVKMPDRVPAGSVSHEIATAMDLLPTFAAMAGATPSAELDGKDISELLADPKVQTPHETFLYYHKAGFLSAIRMGDWKLIFERPVAEGNKQFEQVNYPWSGMKPELYNLKDDMAESYNLASKFPERVQLMCERAKIEETKLSH